MFGLKIERKARSVPRRRSFHLPLQRLDVPIGLAFPCCFYSYSYRDSKSWRLDIFYDQTLIALERMSLIFPSSWDFLCIFISIFEITAISLFILCCPSSIRNQCWISSFPAFTRFIGIRGALYFIIGYQALSRSFFTPRPWIRVSGKWEFSFCSKDGFHPYFSTFNCFN